VLLIPAVVSKEVWYDDAYQRSQAEIRKALPLAEKLEVSIALENVWNNFLVSPLEMAQYIDEFENPWLRAYFDVGNCMRYGWPEQWARILGKRIIKLDIKEYSLTKQNEEGLWKGFVDLWEGDCDWPAVMKTVREIGNTDGWGTAEIAGGGPDRMRDIAEKMDRIYAS
jgi:hexulose-6-phosphate isomerase